MPDDSRKLLWKADELPAQERATTQRLNPNSYLLRTGLSRLAGLQRAHVSLGRIPPGKDSFRLPFPHGRGGMGLHPVRARPR